MGLPASLDIDRRTAEESAVREALESADVTRFESERLDRLHRLLYPVFVVTYSYTGTGHMVRGEEHRTDTILVDGLWSGNDSDIAYYTDGATETERVDPGRYDLGIDRDGPGRTVLFEFQATNERAAALLADRIGRYFTDNGHGEAYAAELRRTFDFDGSFEFEAFADVESVERAYLPFWIAEFHDDGEDSATLRAVRDADDVRTDDRSHSWLASFVGADPTRLIEYGYRLSGAGGADGPSIDDGQKRDRAAAGGGERGDEPTGDPSETGVVQPEGVELDAETLLDPSPTAGSATWAG
ncbi:hypothetical protein GJ629_14900 [Halapricum sp. CBA1109]|uniref:hypothetical protein n=1 Tax=Halapricum sp. CBA1109 TaxID=2668068 RepID=UPI0012FA1DDC|nr:hypothetical protein [Halapricum sp. CBA1109]MUV91015.1 hypothetical protein [Halapricum sp. CBA1109]